MTNLQIIHVIINILLTGPTEVYKISDKLLSLGFDSAKISLVLDALIDDKQIKIDKNWKAYLNPNVED